MTQPSKAAEMEVSRGRLLKWIRQAAAVPLPDDDFFFASPGLPTSNLEAGHPSVFRLELGGDFPVTATAFHYGGGWVATNAHVLSILDLDSARLVNHTAEHVLADSPRAFCFPPPAHLSSSVFDLTLIEVPALRKSPGLIQMCSMVPDYGVPRVGTRVTVVHFGEKGKDNPLQVSKGKIVRIGAPRSSCCSENCPAFSLLEHDAPTRPGASGAPVFGLYGGKSILLGMCVGGSRADHKVNYALPARLSNCWDENHALASYGFQKTFGRFVSCLASTLHAQLSPQDLETATSFSCAFLSNGEVITTKKPFPFSHSPGCLAFTPALTHATEDLFVRHQANFRERQRRFEQSAPAPSPPFLETLSAACNWEVVCLGCNVLSLEKERLDASVKALVDQPTMLSSTMMKALQNRLPTKRKRKPTHFGFMLARVQYKEVRTNNFEGCHFLSAMAANHREGDEGDLMFGDERGTSDVHTEVYCINRLAARLLAERQQHRIHAVKLVFWTQLPVCSGCAAHISKLEQALLAHKRVHFEATPQWWTWEQIRL